MIVYVEIAFLENFLLDGVLLFLALSCARVKISVWRLMLSAAIGALEAVLFPAIVLPAWGAYAVKFLGGVLLILVAVREKRVKPYLIASAAFFFFTFALGGLLTAAYSFFNVQYAEGKGYFVEGAPVGLVFGCAAIFTLAVFHISKSFYRYRQVKKNLLACTLKAGSREVRWQGLADSGNCLFYHGKPVCVTSAAAIFALFGKCVKEAGRMIVGTVNGNREAPVFKCERMQITAGEKTLVREEVYLTVGEVSAEYQLILHTALMEA